MSGPRTPSPSPPAGEGAEPPKRSAGGEAGEGAFGMARAAAAVAPASLATSRARTLRAHMTDAERKLWFVLRDRRFANFKFRRQVPMGPFIADFICYDARVVIEVDGGQHAESRRDERRDRWFAANNFVVLRFWNHDVLKSPEGVLTVILERLNESTPHPARAARGRPSPARGEGDRTRCKGSEKGHER